MATVNQIYQLVNDSAAEALGAQAISVKNTSTLVSLGDVVLSSADNKDAFYSALVDRIGRTAIAIRQYRAQTRSVRKDEMEWGLVYQKISFKKVNATTNPTWTVPSAGQASPFDVTPQTEAIQKLFSVMATWSYEDVIPDVQLKSAFLSAEKMGAFISGIYTNIENSLEQDDEDLANLAVATMMAGAFSSSNTNQVRYLLDEYNTANGTNLTAAEALRSSAFLKYASREIALVTKRMKKMGVHFNDQSVPRFTPEDKMVVEVLADFATATASYLEADTYHDELVKLPRYEEVAYWQATGTAYSFNDVSKIDIQHTSINSGNEVAKSGIIACVHDYDAASSIIYNRRDNSEYNKRSEVYVVMMKADKGYAVDTSENCVVFALTNSDL